MLKKLDALQEKKNAILNSLSSIQNEIYALEVTDDVKKYLELKHYLIHMIESLSKIEEEINFLKMEDCLHMFIQTNPASELGNGPVYHCLRCGLTNLYEENIVDRELSDYEKQMNEVYDKTKNQCMRLRIYSNDIDYYSSKLRELELENPYSTDIRLGYELEYIFRKENEYETENVKVLKK